MKHCLKVKDVEQHSNNDCYMKFSEGKMQPNTHF